MHINKYFYKCITVSELIISCRQMAGGSLKIKVGKTQNKTPKYHQIVCRGVKEQQYNENIHCP